MVFQSYALYPHMTVDDNIGFALKLAKVPQDERIRRVHDVAEMLGITELLDRKPRAALGRSASACRDGSRHRARAAVFLHGRTAVEPRRETARRPRSDIAKLQRELQVTTVYVTHDQVEAMTMGDRVAVMDFGVAPAGRHPAQPLRLSRQPVRGRIHRLPADEPPAGTPRRELGPSGRARGGHSGHDLAQRGGDDRFRRRAAPHHQGGRRHAGGGHGRRGLGADNYVYGTSDVKGTPHSVIVRVPGRQVPAKGDPST